MKTMSTSDRNSNMTFVRNEFTKVLENYDQLKNLNYIWSPKDDDDYFLELVGCKICSKRILKLKCIHGPVPTAWELKFWGINFVLADKIWKLSS